MRYVGIIERTVAGPLRGHGPSAKPRSRPRGASESGPDADHGA